MYIQFHSIYSSFNIFCKSSVVQSRPNSFHLNIKCDLFMCYLLCCVNHNNGIFVFAFS